MVKYPADLLRAVQRIAYVTVSMNIFRTTKYYVPTIFFFYYYYKVDIQAVLVSI